MADELYVMLPQSLVAEVEDDGVEEVESFRTGELAHVVDLTVQVVAVGGNLATIALASDAVRGFARRLCRAVLRRSDPGAPSVELNLVVHTPSGEQSVRVELKRTSGTEPDEEGVDRVRAALDAGFEKEE